MMNYMYVKHIDCSGPARSKKLLVYYAMLQECGSLSNDSENEHEHECRVITATRNLYAAYQATESCSGWGTNMQFYLLLLLKKLRASLMLTHSAVAYKNYNSYFFANISVQFISNMYVQE